MNACPPQVIGTKEKTIWATDVEPFYDKDYDRETYGCRAIGTEIVDVLGYKAWTPTISITFADAGTYPDQEYTGTVWLRIIRPSTRADLVTMPGLTPRSSGDSIHVRTTLRYYMGMGGCMPSVFIRRTIKRRD